MTETDKDKSKVGIGTKLVDAGVITLNEFSDVLEKQRNLDKIGRAFRFGEIAVHNGYCTKEQIESLPGYIGNKLIQSGILTEIQRSVLFDLQLEQRKTGNYILFGELAVQQGFCTFDDIKEAISLNSS